MKAIAVALLGLALAAPASAAVALDANATASVTSNSVTTKDLTTLTVGAGANRALVVQVNWGMTAGLPVTGITVVWDQGGTNQSCAQIISQVSTTLLQSALFGLVAPTSGAKTLRVTWTGGGVGGLADIVINAIAFTGVDQTGGVTTFPNSTSTVNSASPSTITITSAVGNATVTCVSVAGNPSGPNQTQTHLNTTPANLSAAGEWAVGAATVTHQWSVAGGQYVMVGTDIKASAGAAGPPTRTLLGVGKAL